MQVGCVRSVRNLQTRSIPKSALSRFVGSLPEGPNRNDISAIPLLEKLHDKDYYDKGAFLGRVAAQHPLKQRIETDEVQNARVVLRL